MAKRSSPVTAGSTSSQKLFDYNGGRTRIIVQNQDATATCYVNLGIPATVGAGNIKIDPKGYWSETDLTEAMYLIADAGAPLICAWEV